MILIYDTETTGLPRWNDPSEDPRQPHIVQLAAVLVDRQNGEIDRMNVIVRPDGWRIPDDVIEIHGITNERAKEEGIAEFDAVQRLLEMSARAEMRCGHNVSFDDRILRIALHRYFSPEEADRWRDSCPAICTMKSATGIISSKWPKLGEIYSHFFARELAGAHQAMTDVEGCREVLWQLVATGLVILPEFAAAA